MPDARFSESCPWEPAGLRETQQNSFRVGASGGLCVVVGLLVWVLHVSIYYKLQVYHPRHRSICIARLAGSEKSKKTKTKDVAPPCLATARSPNCEFAPIKKLIPDIKKNQRKLITCGVPTASP
eukprot:scaffold4786_cov198-Amphora_coffeaeformis.AAC.11